MSAIAAGAIGIGPIAVLRRLRPVASVDAAKILPGRRMRVPRDDRNIKVHAP